MTLTKFLLSTIITMAMPLATFAASGAIDGYNSNPTWSGSFTIENGAVFHRLPASVLFVYCGKSASHAISHSKLIVSKESGIDDWKPRCDLTLTTEMTAQEFFKALSLATSIKEIQPPELAKFLNSAGGTKGLDRDEEGKDSKEALAISTPPAVKVSESLPAIKAMRVTFLKAFQRMTNAEIAVHLGLTEDEVAALS